MKLVSFEMSLLRNHEVHSKYRCMERSSMAVIVYGKTHFSLSLSPSELACLHSDIIEMYIVAFWRHEDDDDSSGALGWKIP